MLLDALERFFNALCDMDWVWWPLLRLRPQRDVNFQASFFVRVFLGEFALFATLLFVSVLAVAGGDVISTMSYFLTPSGIALLLSDVLFSFATSSPFYFFWNRRAARLRLNPPLPEEIIHRPDVWPPPPRFPKAP